ncbi:hypothetical protein D3C84_1082930 [compost metagenome]
MPTIWVRALASVSTVAAGAFCTNRSPLLPCLKAYSTKSTASASVIMKRVMFGSVIDSGTPWRICSMNNGITEPRDAITLP